MGKAVGNKKQMIGKRESSHSMALRIKSENILEVTMKSVLHNAHISLESSNFDDILEQRDVYKICAQTTNTDEEGREKQRTRAATAPDKSLIDRWLAENKGTATAHKAELWDYSKHTEIIMKCSVQRITIQISYLDSFNVYLYSDEDYENTKSADKGKWLCNRMESEQAADCYSAWERTIDSKKIIAVGKNRHALQLQNQSKTDKGKKMNVTEKEEAACLSIDAMNGFDHLWILERSGTEWSNLEYQETINLKVFNVVPLPNSDHYEEVNESRHRAEHQSTDAPGEENRLRETKEKRINKFNKDIDDYCQSSCITSRIRRFKGQKPKLVYIYQETVTDRYIVEIYLEIMGTLLVPTICLHSHVAPEDLNIPHDQTVKENKQLIKQVGSDDASLRTRKEDKERLLVALLSASDSRNLLNLLFAQFLSFIKGGKTQFTTSEDWDKFTYSYMTWADQKTDEWTGERRMDKEQKAKKRNESSRHFNFLTPISTGYITVSGFNDNSHTLLTNTVDKDVKTHLIGKPSDRFSRHTTLTPSITFRVEVYKDANNSSYLCFDICLLLFIPKVEQTNHEKTKAPEDGRLTTRKSSCSLCLAPFSLSFTMVIAQTAQRTCHKAYCDRNLKGRGVHTVRAGFETGVVKTTRVGQDKKKFNCILKREYKTALFARYCVRIPARTKERGTDTASEMLTFILISNNKGSQKNETCGSPVSETHAKSFLEKSFRESEEETSYKEEKCIERTGLNPIKLHPLDDFFSDQHKNDDKVAKWHYNKLILKYQQNEHFEQADKMGDEMLTDVQDVDWALYPTLGFLICLEMDVTTANSSFSKFRKGKDGATRQPSVLHSHVGGSRLGSDLEILSNSSATDKEAAIDKKMYSAHQKDVSVWRVHSVEVSTPLADLLRSILPTTLLVVLGGGGCSFAEDCTDLKAHLGIYMRLNAFNQDQKHEELEGMDLKDSFLSYPTRKLSPNRNHQPCVIASKEYKHLYLHDRSPMRISALKNVFVPTSIWGKNIAFNHSDMACGTQWIKQEMTDAIAKVSKDAILCMLFLKIVKLHIMHPSHSNFHVVSTTTHYLLFCWALLALLAFATRLNKPACSGPWTRDPGFEIRSSACCSGASLSGKAVSNRGNLRPCRSNFLPRAGLPRFQLYIFRQELNTSPPHPPRLTPLTVAETGIRYGWQPWRSAKNSDLNLASPDTTVEEGTSILGAKPILKTVKQSDEDCQLRVSDQMPETNDLSDSWDESLGAGCSHGTPNYSSSHHLFSGAAAPCQSSPITRLTLSGLNLSPEQSIAAAFSAASWWPLGFTGAAHPLVWPSMRMAGRMWLQMMQLTVTPAVAGVSCLLEKRRGCWIGSKTNNESQAYPWQKIHSGPRTQPWRHPAFCEEASPLVTKPSKTLCSPWSSPHPKLTPEVWLFSALASCLSATYLQVTPLNLLPQLSLHCSCDVHSPVAFQPEMRSSDLASQQLAQRGKKRLALGDRLEHLEIPHTFRLSLSCLGASSS
ncbi:hypothetical protein Celaphus_00018910 [Cervus elaphus hippelaphus]|uniref:Uncharacterized protein n=1 Tax=Cervus elaphus hippelaphus TaxID=46360 RepID=A0A212C6C0_CEREH|nr:hypothetical protein Celaphus_00018910 [Cervus elaphus hippelaphus]